MANESVKAGSSEVPLQKALSQAIEIKPDEIAARQKIRAQRATERDFESAFGRKAQRSKNGKKWRIPINGTKDLAKALDMMSQGSKADQDWHSNFSARQDRVTLRDRDGNEVSALVGAAEGIARAKGFHEKPRWGRPSARYKVIDGQVVRIA